MQLIVKRSLFFAVLFFLITIPFLVQAQISADQNSDSQFSHLLSVGTPSPTAASLGVYANYPVGNFTGVPNISVPLYEINEGGYKLPISLSYNASGIKVDDIASWVGLGWSINAGGLITRNVKGVPDDEDSQNVGVDGSGVGVGFLFRNYNKTVADINTMYSNVKWGTIQNPTPVTDPNSLFTIVPPQVGFNPGSQYTSTDLLFLRRRNVDMEPDLFYFNFNGHTGKFIFSQGTDQVTNCGTVAPDQHQILQIPQQDLKISYLLNNGYLQSRNEPYENTDWLQSFTIVDEDGNQYLFDQHETTWLHTTINSPSNFGTTAGEVQKTFSDVTFTSSWYLSKITTVLGKVINFNYTQENMTNTLTPTDETSGFNGVPQNTSSTSTSSINYITGLRLTSISGDDFIVYFDGNLSRQDFPGSSALTAVRVFSKDQAGNQNLIKAFYFNYGYLQSPNMPTSGNSDYMRLMLTSLVEMASDGKTLKPSYQFNYSGFNSNDTIPPLPNRLSAQEDFWGYFNNNGSNNTLLSNIIPTIYVYPNYSRQDHLSVLQLNSPDPNDPVFTIPGANRNTNTTAILSGTLNKIVYPTGGSVSFKFEADQFNYEGRNYTGGGLRLAQSTTYDGMNTANNIVKQYTYLQSANASQSSGVLFNLPNYAYTENFENYWNGSDPHGQTTEFDPETIDYYNHNLVVGNVPVYTMSGFDGVNVGYATITESLNANGKTVSNYSVPGQYGDMSDGDNLFEAPYALIIDQANNHLPPSTCNTEFMDATGLNTDAWGFPFGPSLNYDWNRGKLLSSIVYNQTGNPVYEEDYNYKLYTPQNVAPRYVLGLTDREASNYHLWINLCTTTNEKLTYYDHISQYKIITNIAKILSSKTIKAYDSSTPANVSTTTTTYTYSPNCMKPHLIETTTSEGGLIDDYLTYPPDYVGQTTTNAYSANATALNFMQQQNIVNPVVENYEIRKNADGSNARFTGGSLTTFKSQSSLPDVVYRSESLAPISNYVPATMTDGPVTMDASYKPTWSFDTYGTNGNVLQSHKIGDVNNSYIYDYNNQYVVAEVTNANLSDISYTSFEADGNGGWAFDPSLIINFPCPTGSKCYNFSSEQITRTNLDPTKTYILSYWLRNGSGPLVISNGSAPVTNNVVTQGSTVNGWTYYQHQLSGTSEILLVAGSYMLDELRLYPKGAQMVTSTYDQAGDVTSSTDAKGQTTYYEYDIFQRLTNVKDKDGNIIKHMTYHYQGQ